MSEDDSFGESQTRTKIGLKQVLVSTFGIYFAILVLTSVANNGVNAQIANIMPEVYGIDARTTSALISIAGLLNILLYFPAGRWMAKKGGFSPFTVGIAARMAAGLGMGAVGMMTDNKVLLGAAFMQLMYNAAPFVRLPQAGLAVRFASFPAGQANGWVIAASALGSFVGALLGGFLAEGVRLQLGELDGRDRRCRVLCHLVPLAPPGRETACRTRARAGTCLERRRGVTP